MYDAVEHIFGRLLFKALACGIAGFAILIYCTLFGGTLSLQTTMHIENINTNKMVKKRVLPWTEVAHSISVNKAIIYFGRRGRE